MAGRRFSRWWGISASSADDAPSPVLQMFVQDAHARIMPYRPGASRSRLGAMFDGGDDATRVMTRICAGLDEHSSAYEPPIELVSNAIRKISQYLLWRGRVVFELPEVRELAADNTPSLRDQQRIIPITGELLLALPGRVIGMRIAKRRSWEKAYSVITSRSSRSLWHLSMPRVLGGKSGYARILRRLDGCPLVMPHWASQSMTTEHERIRFDVAAYARLSSAYVARSSGPFGWPARETSLEHQTEFFLFLGYPFNRSISTPISTGGSPVAAPSSAGAHARVAVLAGLSGADGW